MMVNMCASGASIFDRGNPLSLFRAKDVLSFLIAPRPNTYDPYIATAPSS